MIGRKTLKKILIGLLGGILLLAACGQTPPVAQTAPIPLIESATVTFSPMPTSTITTMPSATPTASITPLPTIPTFTPTFDASTIVTVTPAPKAECPNVDPTIKPESFLPEELRFPSPNVTGNLLEFLNKGGSGKTLVERLDRIYLKSDYIGGYAFSDVTGDQIPEFLYVELHHGGKPIVFSCRNGSFEPLATLSGQHDSTVYAMEVDDLNTDGIPELLVMGTDGVSHPQSKLYLYEWNGRTFTILMETGMSALRQMEVKDVDKDGTKEMIFIGDNPVCVSCSNYIPQRQRTVSYTWNGKDFVETSNEFEPPEYRFQAVQDADAAVIIGKYDEAIRLYEEAISDQKLEWWSPERLTYEQHIGNPVYMFVATPSAIPTEEITEYPRLAAYAHYRIMLIHLVQGNEGEAETTYKTLQEKFGSNPYGQSYVEMATAFWGAYQSTHKMYDGCAAAIQYAAEHPQILTPLGSDYHGWQSHTYVPADVCPFR